VGVRVDFIDIVLHGISVVERKHPYRDGRVRDLAGWSQDGLTWSAAADVVVVGLQGARTPLRLLPEPDRTVSVYYTNCPCGKLVRQATFRLAGV
jgi:hypothetical protein